MPAGIPNLGTGGLEGDRRPRPSRRRAVERRARSANCACPSSGAAADGARRRSNKISTRSTTTGSGPLTCTGMAHRARRGPHLFQIVLFSTEEGHSMTSGRFLSVVGAFALFVGACGGQDGGKSTGSGGAAGTG